MKADDLRLIDLTREPPLRLGQMDLRPATREVVTDSAAQVLEPRIMQVLVSLARRRGEVVSRDDLIAECWGGRAVGDDAINRCVQAIRKLADERSGFSITTIARVGYRLEENNAPAALASAPIAICVLPFANMSGDPEQEYFSDGVTEDIITDLSKISALSVVARNTAFTLKGKHVEVPEVAARLKVSHVLEGSVRRAGDKVRITAQLVDGVAGDHIWAERYDRELSEIFALQDEISQAIVTALKLKLLPQEKAAIEQRGTTSAQAYDHYLMARQFREAKDIRHQEATIRFCELAVAIDPNYAVAWTLMAAAQMTLVHSHRQAGDAGAAAIERALALDPHLGEAHALRARQLQLSGHRDEAYEELELALHLDPGSGEVNYRAGMFHYAERRFPEAIHYLEKATALNQTDFLPPALLMRAATALGDRVAALAAARTTLARVEEILAQDRTNGTVMSFGVASFAVLGERQRADEWINRAMIVDPDNLVMRYTFACTLSSLRDTEAALEMLAPLLASSQAGVYLVMANSERALDPIREDPRFKDMVAAAKARLAASPS